LSLNIYLLNFLIFNYLLCLIGVEEVEN